MTDNMPADGDPGDPGVPDPAADPAVEPVTPAAEPTPVWAGPSQDEWGATVSAVQALGQYAPILGQLSQMLAQPPTPDLADVPEIDPFDPESIDQHINARLEQALAQRVAPYEQAMQAQAAREGRQVARQELDRIASTLGETDPEKPVFSRDHAEALAHLFMRMGHDPGRSLAAAAQHQHEFEQTIRKQAAEQAVEAYKQQLEAIGNAPRTPGVTGGSAAEIVEFPTGKGWHEELAKRFTG